MATSQNGWPAQNTTAGFVRGTAAKFGFWCANDDVRVIFEDLVTRFNRDIEAIAGTILDDWSWANRNVRGSDTQVSNHASATALDLNALKHPRGVWRTFSEAKRTAIRKLIARYDGAIRWGGDYQNIPDDMHFEINAGKAAIKKVADKIRAELKAAAQREEDMNLTKENLEDIAKAVLNLDIIPNKNAPKDSKNPEWSLKSMISNIEHQQDNDSDILKSHTDMLNELKLSVEKLAVLLRAK